MIKLPQSCIIKTETIEILSRLQKCWRTSQNKFHWKSFKDGYKIATLIKRTKREIVGRHNDGARHGVKYRKLYLFIQLDRGLSETGTHLQLLTSELPPATTNDRFKCFVNNVSSVWQPKIVDSFHIAVKVVRIFVNIHIVALLPSYFYTFFVNKN